MGGGDYVLLLAARMANLRKVQRLAQSGVLVVSIASRRLKFRAFIMMDRGLASTCDRENQHVSGAARTAFIPKMAQYRPELIIRLGIDIETASPASLTMTMPSCRTKSVSCRDWL